MPLKIDSESVAKTNSNNRSLCMYHFYNTFMKTCINHVNLVVECWMIYIYILHVVFQLIDLCATVSNNCIDVM